MASPFNNYVANKFVVHNSGKTSLALTTAAQAQAEGGTVAFIDAEFALDLEWTKLCGVNIDTMHYVQPDTGEQALEAVELMVKSGVIDFIIIDSVAALTPRAEIEGDMGDSHMGLQARLMSQALRKLAGPVHKSNCVVVFINQIREKIGNTYGNPETTTGGRALKFYASLRMEVRKGDRIGPKDDPIGGYMKVNVTKNKTAPPYQKAIVPILFHKGMDISGEVLDLAVEFGWATKSGAWYYQGETRLGQGRDAAVEYLDTHPEVVAHLRDRVLHTFRTGEVV
jgi:recombination protein RecA